MATHQFSQPELFRAAFDTLEDGACLFERLPLRADGLRRLISAHPELLVVGEAADGVQAIQRSHQLRPHVVVMDVSMPVLDGVKATRQLLAEIPGVQVVGLSTYEDDGSHAITRAGAVAYFNKRHGVQDLVQWLLAAQSTPAKGRGP